jgi:hypothetical protein
MQKLSHLTPSEVLNLACRLKRNHFECLAHRPDRDRCYD